MEEQEISLRELIEVLLKNKLIIAGITAVCVLVAFAYSFYIAEPIYQAEAKLIVSDLKRNQPNIDNIYGIIDNYASYPNFTVASYKDQIKNPEILYKVREQLQLKPEEYSLSGLANMITVDNPQNTNVLSIKVKEQNPELAAGIANTLAINFSDFISTLTQRQASKSLEYIVGQMKVEEENLNKVLTEYKTFLQQPRGVAELESEIGSKINLLTGLKEQLAQIDINSSIAKTTLNAAQRELDNTERILTTKKSLIDDLALYNYVQNSHASDIGNTLTIELYNEEINPNYLEVDSVIKKTQIQIAEYEAAKVQVNNQIIIVQSQLEQLQVELAEKKIQSDNLHRKVETAQKTYNAFLDKYEESRLTQSGEFGKNAVVVSSEAMVPLRPVAPNKALNVAIAGVLGIMLGVFVAFFKEYWISSGKNYTAQG